MTLGLGSAALAACATEDVGQAAAPDLGLPADVGTTAPVSAAPIDLATEIQVGDTEFIPLGEFEGYANPATGEMTIEMVPMAAEATRVAEGDVATVEQASWCQGLIIADGTTGSNPNSSFEVYTDPTTIASSPIGGPVASACNVGNGALYSVSGVFCAAVRVQNFYAYDWPNVHLQLYVFGGDLAARGPYVYPLGTGAVDPGGLPAPGDDIGLWNYGSLASRGQPGDRNTVIWTFKNESATAFRFRGRVLGEVQEICGDDVDNDCDGIQDDGCYEFVVGAPCLDDSDCTTGTCDAGICDDQCGPGRFGPTCAECPGGAASPCSNNGVCDDGPLGTGVCTCDAGSTGADCGTCAADYFGGQRILMISDYLTADSAIGSVLAQAGYEVTTVSNAYNLTTDVTTFPADLNQYAAIFWSASKEGIISSTDLHAASTFDPLNDYVDQGGWVFVTGYDSVAFPSSPEMLAFIGASVTDDTFGPMGTVTSDPAAAAITGGVFNIAGATVAGLNSDRDELTALVPGTVPVITSAPNSYTAVTRVQNLGRVVYFSNGASGSGSHASWSDVTNVAYKAVRNFAFNAVAAATARGIDPACVACNCVNGTCDDGNTGTGACTCFPGWDGADCNGCQEGFFGSACTACASCNESNLGGVCVDEVAGDGSCDCNSGFHGSNCGFTCDDGVQNGGELFADCAGPCAAPEAGVIAFNMRPQPATALSLSDDGLSTAIPIGFPFTFFGQTYNNVHIGNNGFITFSDLGISGCCSGAPIPTATGIQNFVALYWEDLAPGTVYYGTTGTSPNREFVVAWNHTHFGGSAPVVGQIVLREQANEVQTHCQNCVTDGGLHTQGIENADGTLGVTGNGLNAQSATLVNAGAAYRTDGCAKVGSGAACTDSIQCPFGTECDAGFCSCAEGFTGLGCTECEAGYFGPSCTACPGGAATECSGHGVCDDGSAGTGTCSCSGGWAGAACNQRPAQYTEDFGDNLHEWALNGWTWSTDRLSFAYGNNTNQAALTPRMDCAAEPADMQVTFQLSGQVESCCDDIFVDYSLNAGGTWATLPTSYFGVFDGSTRSVTIPGSAGLSDVRVRFRLVSDSSTTYTAELDNFTSSCLLAPAPTDKYSEDFADGDHGATLTGWTVASGALRYPSYPNSVSQAAVLPAFRCGGIPGDLVVNYTLSGSTELSFDYVRLQYSTDSGTTWTTQQSYTGVLPGTVQTHELVGTAARSGVLVRFLMESDFSGSDTGPVIDDITASCPRAPAYEQDFNTNAADWGLSGWSRVSNQLQYAYPSSANSSAETPQFNCAPSTSDMTLGFDITGQTESCCDDIFVEYSIDNGTSWTQAANYFGTMPGANTSLLLPGTAGQANVKARFRLQSDSSLNYTVFLDNVTSSCAQAPVIPPTATYTQNFANNAHGWSLLGTFVYSSVNGNVSNAYPSNVSDTAPYSNYMLSPRLDCSTATGNGALSVDVNGFLEGTWDYLRVDVSTDNGATFTNAVASWTGSAISGAQTATISGIAGQNDVVIRLRLKSDSSTTGTFTVDNVSLTGCSEFAPIYTQDFATSPAPPWALWGLWTVSGGAASHVYNSSVDSSMYLPVLSCAGRSNAVLTFDLAAELEETYDFVDVQTSIDGGTGWSTQASYTGSVNLVGNAVTLASTGGVSDVRVRFRFTSDSSLTFTAPVIDNVSITCPVIASAPQPPPPPTACASAAPFSTNFNTNNGCFTAAANTTGSATGAQRDWTWSGTAWRLPASGTYASSIGTRTSATVSSGGSTITSGPLDCTGVSTLTANFNLTGQSETTWDWLSLQVSKDGGLTYTNVRRWSNSSTSVVAFDRSSAWSGSAFAALSAFTGPAATASFSLGGTSFSNVRVRFMFTSDSSGNYAGPIVDDFVVNCAHL